MTANGWLQIGLFFALILLCAKPLGVYMARVFGREKTFFDVLARPVERLIYKLTGIDEDHEMKWTEYAIAMLVFSFVTMIVTYAIERLQHMLPLNPQGLANVAPDLALNTAASFTTNTNWQSYVPEATMSYLTQMMTLAYHNFASAAVGIALAIAFVRGIAGCEKKTLGNFWVDTTRATLWVLLPGSLVLALVLVSQGVVQNFRPYDQAKLVQPLQTQVTGADGKTTTQTITTQTIGQGPVASQEAIKMLGTNGGGFFNANSAHPFEESERADQLPGDICDLRHPGSADGDAWPHGEVTRSWLGDLRRDVRAFPCRSLCRLLVGESRQSFAAQCERNCERDAERRQHGGQGGPLRHCGLGALRNRND